MVIGIPSDALVLLVGASGSGKTTFVAHHFAPADVLSSDVYRALVSGDPADQRATRRAFGMLHAELERRLARGRLTVVDATNVTRRARLALLVRARRAGRPVVAIVLEVTEAVAQARNCQRPARVVPEPVVSRHVRELAATLAAGHLDGEGYLDVHRLGAEATGEVRILRVTAARGSGSRGRASGSPPGSRPA